MEGSLPAVPEIRWEHVRKLARQTIQRRLHRASASDVDDLAQESMVRLVRYVRREIPQNVDALTTAIADRVATDFIRRRGRWSLIVNDSVDVGDLDEVVGKTDPETWGDPVARVGVVVKHCLRESPDCLRLADRFLAEIDWAKVAAELGLSHAAVRQRWKRCLDQVRRTVSDDPGLREQLGWEGGA